MKYLLSVSCLLVLAFAVAAQIPAGQSARMRNLRVRQQAFAEPFNEDKVRALMTLLPRDGDFYIVEGDILLTEQELRAYIVVQSQSDKPVDPSSELIVNSHSGQRDYYKDPSQRKLTFAVDRQSFPNEAMYKEVVVNMKAAASDWEAACPQCGLQFLYQPDLDLKPSTQKVNFVVQFRDVRGAYIAAAFFPHDGPSKRYVNIDPSYFTTRFDKTGVLRHELGHVLGYRHEQTRGVPDCYYEDNNWQPLTEYDSQSVMHYFCGGGGSFKLNLSDLDKAGHRKLYQITDVTNLYRNVKVRFEGPDLAKATPQVLTILTGQGLIQSKTYTVETSRETLQSVYAEQLQLTVISTSMLNYAAGLNKGLSRKVLKPGDVVRLPDVQFKPYQKVLVLRTNDEADIATYKKTKAIWPAKLITEVRKDPTTLALILKSQELNIPNLSYEKEQEARKVLRTFKAETGARYVVLAAPSISTKAAAVYTLGSGISLSGPTKFAIASRPQPSPSPNASPVPCPAASAGKQTGGEYFIRVQSGEPVPVGFEGDLTLSLGEGDFPRPTSPCDQREGDVCPEIILVDKRVELHPDFPATIKDANGVALSTTSSLSNVAPIDSTTNCQSVRFELAGVGIRPEKHGTYMAGILLSQPNGFGLIGVNPTAQLTTYDWDAVVAADQSQVSTFRDFISERQANFVLGPGKVSIFVFAGEWSYRDPFVVEGAGSDQSKAPLMRFDTDAQERPDAWRTLARVIKESRPLVIAAAGQGKDGQVPTEFSVLSLKGPRNLGDLENVIVVTASQLAADGRAQIWTSANFNPAEGTRLIHVAAPGIDIVSTVHSNTAGAAFYGRDSGTSPATAFVAGVVSSMIAAWPDDYKQPVIVKTRLQLTSNPFLRRSDAGKLAAGIVDFNLAMHNRNRHWFKQTNDTQYFDATNVRWLVREIELVDSNFNRIGEPIKTKDIYRIMYRNQICYIYTNAKDKEGKIILGEIRKFGPGTLRGTLVNELELLQLRKTSGGEITSYTLNQIQDLLLANTIGN